MKQVDIPKITAPAIKIEPCIASIIEKAFALLKIYKTTLFERFPVELLDNNNLYNNLNQMLLNFINQPETIIKLLLANNPNACLYATENNSAILLHGINNFLDELICNNGHLSLSMLDKNAYKVGVNLAITPGKIIYQNELMQLIQYLPATDTVYASSILFIPPWINKYYVLDLKPENSMVKWLVERGFTVFMISWINPDKRLANKCWGNYLLEGPITALNIITKKIKAPVHMVVYYLVY